MKRVTELTTPPIVGRCGPYNQRFAPGDHRLGLEVELGPKPAVRVRLEGAVSL